MKEIKEVENNKINTEKKNELNFEAKIKSLSDEVIKIQNSFSNLLAQDQKLKKQIDKIAAQKNDLLDNEIWVINKIEEAKQETETLIYEKIKKLNYEKTIKTLNETLEKITKNIELVDYNKTREIENVEEDLILKIEDSKVIEDSIIEDKILNAIEETIKNLKKDITSLEKKVNKEITNVIKELQKNQENKFEKFAKEISDKLEKELLKKEEQEKIDIKKQEGNFRKKLEFYTDVVNEKDEISDSSVVNAYTNVKHTNHIKDLLIENNKAILTEVAKYDKKVSKILKELDTLQDNIAKIQIATTKDLNGLEARLNNNIIVANEKTKQETNKAVENLIERIEAAKKISEEQQKTIRQILDKKIQESENKNKELLNQKIQELNIDKIKDNITKLEELTTFKINELSSLFEGKIEASELKNQQLIIKEIAKLEIEKLKAEFKELESSTSIKVQEIENILSDKIEEEKIENEKLISKAIEELNIDEVKTSINDLEKTSLEKLQELETVLTSKIEEEKIRNDQSVLKAIEELNVEEIKNSITKLEEISAEKIKELEGIINTKIDDLNYFDTIRDIENSLIELKENVLNTEYANKAISKKVEELDSINQKKLDKVKKEQEKFIIQKISELDTADEINNIKISLEEITKKIQDIEELSQVLNEESFSQMRDYVEKRILRMKFATTIQTITEEINAIKQKIELLEDAQSEETPKEDIESIIQARLQEQENEFMSNIEKIIAKRLKEQESKFKKHIELSIEQSYQQPNSYEIEALVEEKVKKTIKEMVKKQKTKKANKVALAKKQPERIQGIELDRRKKLEKSKNNPQKITNSRTNSEIIDSIYSSRKTKARTGPASLDDMVATLSKMPRNTSRNKTQKTISTLAKAVKKSQILNYDNN